MISIQKLYELQELEVEIDSLQRMLAGCLKRLGESKSLIDARAGFLCLKQKIEELKKIQRDTECEIDDISAKLTKANDDLYSGRIKNPKELTNMQQESRAIGLQKSQSEEMLLETMSQIEISMAEQIMISSQLKVIEEEWSKGQQELEIEIGQLKNKITGLQNKRQGMIDDIEPQAMEYYTRLKAQKGLAVAKIEQGMCRGCHISLSTAELQRVRVGHIVECSSCRRMLYLP
jgi:hypothetical protein